mmetsp:Transcript_14619/g.40626  ORF Transcript_14619/g.40626 Transcript_14619/m.40626 type:complete len:99 (-) Transcript_14619:1753-2049(-)
MAAEIRQFHRDHAENSTNHVVDCFFGELRPLSPSDNPRRTTLHRISKATEFNEKNLFAFGYPGQATSVGLRSYKKCAIRSSSNNSAGFSIVLRILLTR